METTIPYKQIVDYSELGIVPEKEIIPDYYKHENWEFYWTNAKMFSGKDHDKLDSLKKVSRLPDMFWGFNRFLIVNKSHNFLFQIDPLEMINFSNFENRKNYYYEKVPNIENFSSLTNSFISYYLPENIKVQFFEKWENIKVDRSDIQKIEPINDWSFCSTYMGTPKTLDSCKAFLTEETDVNTDLGFSICESDLDLPLSLYITKLGLGKNMRS